MLENNLSIGDISQALGFREVDGVVGCN
jgi:hypothetical protein